MVGFVEIAVVAFVAQLAVPSGFSVWETAVSTAADLLLVLP
jgi:hypothetical protein